MNYPPAIRDFDMSPYFDGLEEVITDKLSECLTTINQQELYLKEQKEEILLKRRRGELTQDEIMVMVVCYETVLSEYYFEMKWLRYWLNLMAKLPNNENLNVTITQANEVTAEDIERAKQRDITEFYSGELKRSGSRFLGKCPFHEEKSPSFYIFSDNRWHCFGCSEDGDVIDFVQRINNCSFLEAVKTLL